MKKATNFIKDQMMSSHSQFPGDVCTQAILAGRLFRHEILHVDSCH